MRIRFSTFYRNLSRRSLGTISLNLVRCARGLSDRMLMRKDKDILKQQKVHRGDSRKFVMNFLSNMSRHGRLMRLAMEVCDGKPEIFQTAIKSYIIGIAACLETFFRDLYVHTLEQNPGLLKAALEKISEKESLSTIYENLSDGLSFPEFALRRATFGSVEEIDVNFSTFSKPYGFLDTLNDFELHCGIPSIPSQTRGKLKLGVFCPTWRKDLKRIFELRHEFAHDANSKNEIDPKQMPSIEKSAVVVPQVTAYTYLFRSSEPMKDGTIKVDNSRASVLYLGGSEKLPIPVILMISDLVAEDWVSSEKPRGVQAPPNAKAGFGELTQAR